MPIDDPLRPLSQIYEPDERRANLVGTMAEEYADLASMKLHDGVPLDVRQLFETAKNVSLYSWFVFRFHPVAESVGFAALELALNLRRSGASNLAPDHRSPGLSILLKDAYRESVLRDAGFPSREGYVYQAALQRKIVEAVLAGAENGEIAQPTEDELTAAQADFRLAEYLIALWPSVRNALAHGSPMLVPRSRSTLRLISEAINQLFVNVGSEDAGY